MRLLTITLLAAVLASALFADEAAQANTDKFLAGLKEIDKSVLGTTRYTVNYTGRRVGNMVMTIAEGKYEEGPCYRVDSSFELFIGKNSLKMKYTDYVSAGLKLLYHTSNMTATGEPDTCGTIVLTPEGYVHTKVNKDNELETFRYEAAPRLVESAADVLFNMLLPLEPGKAYETQRWDADQGLHAVTYTIEGEKKVGELSGILVRETYTNLEKDDKGKATSTDVENTQLIGADRKILRITSSERPFTFEYDDGRYTKDEVKQMATPLDPVLAFWMALRDKDVDLLKLTLNEGRYVEEVRAREDGDKDVAEWERKFMKDFAEEKLAAAMLENVDLDESMKLMIDGLSAAWFEITMDGETKAKVGFSPEFAKATGDTSEMWWHLEKNAKTGMWEMVYLETKDDEF
jgi:hypothetical protein